ncbi:MAG: hypothetical protein M3O86_06880 [Actinomycetota bacterium]|nr:hypothetical protein [Actinomycetota bacterium]
MIEPVDMARVVFDPLPMLTALADGGVEFVVIGGIAALLHGDDAGTSDVDATVRRTGQNLALLADVLARLDARLLVAVNDAEQATVDMPISVETFASLTSARFLTRYGVLDVVLHPDGIPDFDDWSANASTIDVGQQTFVPVAALSDVIRSKEAAGRPKDAAALPRLRALRKLGERSST